MDKIKINMPDFSRINQEINDFFKNLSTNINKGVDAVTHWPLDKQLAGGSVVLGTILLIIGIALL